MVVSKIAGINPNDIGLKVLRGTGRPILPDTRERTIVIPGRNGLWDLGADLEPRYLPLDCAFVTRSPAELQANAETLARILVDAYGKPRTVDLAFAVHPDRTYYVRYAGSLPIDRLVGMGRFTLPLVAFDPFAYGPEQVTDVVINESLETFTVSSDGNVATDPVIVIQNTGSTTIHGFTLKNIFLVD